LNFGLEVKVSGTGLRLNYAGALDVNFGKLSTEHYTLQLMDPNHSQEVGGL
jgi:hypothetical protein